MEDTYAGHSVPPAQAGTAVEDTYAGYSVTPAHVGGAGGDTYAGYSVPAAVAGGGTEHTYVGYSVVRALVESLCLPQAACFGVDLLRRHPLPMHPWALAHMCVCVLTEVYFPS